MTHPPWITDDFVLTRWMTMEIGKINEGGVRDRKSLAVLLLEKTPSAVTKKGEPYLFDRDIITLLGVAISLVISVITFAFARQIAVIFTYSPYSTHLGLEIAAFLATMCFFYPFVPPGIMSGSVFRATGKGLTSLVIPYSGTLFSSRYLPT